MNEIPNDPLTSHEYDGIREYDNPTPGWWHLIFLGTVVLCFPYILVWHFSPIGLSPEERHEAEVAAYYRAQFQKFGELTPDEATIGGLMMNADYMNAVKGTFAGKCASCHKADGSGLVGPNLTDDSYINVKSITDIYTTINAGVVLKGMPAWGRQLHPTEVILLSAYVASLRGQDLPGRAPEGEVAPAWPEFAPLQFGDEESDSTEGAVEADESTEGV